MVTVGALSAAEGILTRIGLTLNETKTRICLAPEEPFDFLGYSFGIQYRFGSGSPYLATYPSAKSVRRIKDTLRRMVGSQMSWQREEELIAQVNYRLRGWMNYFSYGTVWKSHRHLEQFLQQRVRGWLVHKHKVGSRGECRYPAHYLYGTLGLVSPTQTLAKLRKP